VSGGAGGGVRAGVDGGAGAIGVVPGTTPYPWPWDDGCPGSQLALVVAGWDAGWRARVDRSPAVVDDAVTALAAGVAGAGGTVVLLDHPAPRVALGERPPALVPPSGIVAHRIRVAGIDGFHGSGLDAALRSAGATHLLMAGHGLEGPVHSTLRSANDRGYECLLVVDACSPLDAGLAPAARSMVEMSGGIFGAVGATADVLAALVPGVVPAGEPAPATT
jgi:biuret amidohydrolase